jgi:hypothetical protein
MVPLIIMSLHSESQLLLQGAGVGGPFLGQSEGLRAPFFGDGPPTSTSFLEGSSTERARRSALRVGLRVEDSHQPQRSDASLLPQSLSLQHPFSGNDTFAYAELGLDHRAGHFRPLSITRQRHWLAYHFIAMRHEGLCQVF